MPLVPRTRPPTTFAALIPDAPLADAVERVEDAAYRLGEWAERAAGGGASRLGLATTLRALAGLVLVSATEIERTA